MALTREQKEGLKIAAMFLAFSLFWVAALIAVFYGASTLDDGGAKQPSEWRK